MDKNIQTRDFFESDEVLRAFFEHSPDSILLVDIHEPPGKWPIVQCNEATWRTHGYEGKRSLLQESWWTLCPDVQDLDVILGELAKNEIAVREVTNVKQDGTPIAVSCTYSLVHLKGTTYLMIVVHDRSEYRQLQESEKRFQAIFENSPDGVVIINPTNGGNGPWLIEECNKAFCEMNGYEHGYLVGKDIRTVSDETALKKELYKEFSEGTMDRLDWSGFYRREYYQRLHQGTIRLEETHRRGDGKIITVEASSCLIWLNGQERVLGIDRDITEARRLYTYLGDLQKDVGRTFHHFSATLLQVKHAVKPAINALDPDPFKPGLAPTADEVWRELGGLRNSLVAALSKMLEARYLPFQNEALSPENWSELEKLLSKISEVESIHIAEQRAPILRKAARQVIDILNNVEKSKIKQEILRDVRRSAEELERMTCLVALRQVQDRLLDTDQLVLDLRERVLTKVKPEEKPSSVEFWPMVQETIEELSEYAAHKGVALRKDNRSGKVHVLVVRGLVVRAVNNLLNNAIKYSWWRDQNTDPWIEIRSYIRGGQVYLEIEDFGVPIPRDEIEQGLVYQFGYRGRLSEQRGRIGTGIGLADAQTIARSHGGDVTMDSRPAPRNASPNDITVPHIKTATLYLPISGGSGR